MKLFIDRRCDDEVEYRHIVIVELCKRRYFRIELDILIMWILHISKVTESN